MRVGMPRILCSFIITSLFTVSALIEVQAQDRAKDHDDLRLMLKTGTEALNSGKVDALAPLLHSNFSITTVDQKLFTNLNDFKNYYDQLLKGPVKSITFNPTADELTVFVGDNIGLSHGTSNDAYLFSDGDSRIMKSRWTATVYKEDGVWKLLNLHIGTDILDNPVVTALKNSLYRAGIGGGIAGLLVGFLLGRVLRRK